MAEGIIGLTASFLVLVALILWLIILSKNKLWIIKSIIIISATLFSIVVLLSLKDFIGWPSKSGLPQEFQLHWAIINEPDKIKNTEGAIYMWITELDNKNKNNGLPRAYKIDYTRKNHEEIMKGLISLGDGIQQKGEKVKAKEDIDIDEDLSCSFTEALTVLREAKRKHLAEIPKLEEELKVAEFAKDRDYKTYRELDDKYEAQFDKLLEAQKEEDVKKSQEEVTV